MCAGEKVTVWEAHPFDEMIDFSAYTPGEVVDVFDGKPVVRTVDGSLLIDRYECRRTIGAGGYSGVAVRHYKWGPTNEKFS